MSRHLIPRLTLGEAESLIGKHGKKGDGMRIFSILVDADKMLHDKGVEISKTHAVVLITDIERSNAARRRLRISHLRRMADLIDERTKVWGQILDGVPEEFRMENSWRRRWYRRMRDLHSACRAEIARLSGEG